MKIIIVHDRNDVAERIAEIAREAHSPIDRIDIAGNAAEARQLLQRVHYDLAFIDLTIPPNDRPSEIGYDVAEHLLQELVWSDVAVTPGDVVGITKDQAAVTRIRTAVGSHLMAVIEEDPQGLWESNVADRVKYVARSGRARLRSLAAIHDIDVLIVTALDEEFEPFRSALTLSEMPEFRGAYSFGFNDRNGRPRRGVIYSVGWAGQATAAASTEALLSRFRPKLALMSGICGGYKTKTFLGQVLAFQTVWDWDSGKWSTDRTGPLFLARPEPISVRGLPVHDAMRGVVRAGLAEQARVLGEAMSLNDSLNKLEVVFAVAASGSAVIANETVGKTIRDHADNIIAIDMESYGFYSACKSTRCTPPAYICIKAVCDFADDKKNDGYHPVAAYLAAATCVDFILYHWSF